MHPPRLWRKKYTPNGNCCAAYATFIDPFMVNSQPNNLNLVINLLSDSCVVCKNHRQGFIIFFFSPRASLVVMFQMEWSKPTT